MCNLAAPAGSVPKDQFKREVEGTDGRESEPWEIIYCKACKTQIPIIEQTIETAALMLGTDKSRGYCLEMICADFLAGANLENEDPTVAPAVHVTILQIPSWGTTPGLPARSERKSVVNPILPKRPRQQLAPELHGRLKEQVLRRDGWKRQCCGTRSNLEVHHLSQPGWR